MAACGEAISSGFSGRVAAGIRVDRSNGSFHMLAAAGGEARPNDMYGSVTATNGEARLCGKLRAMVIATHHF